jgi:hypothetical protein
VRRHLARLLLLGALGAATAAAHGRIPADVRAARGERFVPRPEVARLTALGFGSVLADYYWLTAVQIVGHEGYQGGQGELLAALLDVVTTLDPWVDHPYRFAAVWLHDSLEDVRAANRLLLRGIAHHPDDWRNYFYLGFNHFFWLRDEGEAARVLEEAVGRDGAPAYLKRLVARLKAREAGLEAAALFLRELIQQAPDEYARAEYQKALDEVETERRARLLDAARVAYWKKNGRDIRTIEDLARRPEGVLPGVPPEPHGFEWKLDPASGRFVSSYYGYRYEPQVDPVTEQRRRLLESKAARARKED